MIINNELSLNKDKKILLNIQIKEFLNGTRIY